VSAKKGTWIGGGHKGNINVEQLRVGGGGAKTLGDPFLSQGQDEHRGTKEGTWRG